MNTFAELSSKSCFSFLKGASFPEEIVQTAHRLKYRSIALTDDNGFYGMVRGFKRAEDLEFHFITGTEIKLKIGNVILISKNLTGYKQICRLLSNGFADGSKHPTFKIQDLLELTDQNIFFILPPRNFIGLENLRCLRQACNPIQLITKKFHAESDTALRQWLVKIPNEIPRAWTWDPIYHHPSRHEIAESMQAIRLNKPLSQCLPYPNGELFLKDSRLAIQSGATKKDLQETIRVAEACTFSPREIKYFYPQEWLPQGKTSHHFLKELCDRGLEKRYPSGIPDNVRHQLKHELILIQKMKFEDYFLTVWEVISFARSRNILYQGRGSAANSIVCYLLEITAIDPVRMNLLFERFISEERNEAPDIDIDFESERREEVIQFIYKKYGRERAGMVATLITYRSRSAMRDVKKILEITDQSNSGQLERCKRLAQGLRGFPRHLGQHTGGMILTHDRLDEISPIQKASMPGRSIVQWDKHDIEILGLLKIDFLSLGILTCLKKGFELIEKHYQKNIELHTIPADDLKTYEMIQKSRTIGVFQIESRAQMSMLPRLKPRNFYDLVIQVGIVRPGPIQGGMVHPYLRRRLGLEKVTYEHPKLKPILEKTLGIPIFQEQVMKMAIEVGGYSGGEADSLRRSMGAWKKSGNMEKHSQVLRERLIKNGVSPEFSERVCQQILGFGDYGFPESHAASFALLTYASAYLKAHYPEVFLCALLNSMPMGFYPFHMLTMGFQREGVKILPISTDLSDWDHKLEWYCQDKKFALRLGLRCVRGLHKSHSDLFIESRQKGRVDLFHFNSLERAAIAMASSIEEKRSHYWKNLIPQKDFLNVSREPNIEMPSLQSFESMLLDFKFIETSLGEHPIQLAKRYRWAFSLAQNRITSSDKLSKLKNGDIITVFGMLQIIQRPPTAKGMCFITLEDESGFLNLALTPTIDQKFKDLIKNEWALLVSGKLQNESGSLSILVRHIFKPELND